MLIIVDNEIVLRPLELSDAHDIFTTIDTQRAYLGKWLPFVANTKEVADTMEFVKSVVFAPSHRSELVYTIRVRDEFAGVIGFKDTDSANKKTELGYWLSEKFQKQGVMTRSVEKLCSIAFHEMRMNRVQILCAVGNNPSKQIPIRLGFHLEGIVKEGELLSNGRFTDLEVYRMTRSELLRETPSGCRRSHSAKGSRSRKSYFMDESGSRKPYYAEEISWGNRKELLFVIAASIIAGVIAKIPDFAAIDPDYFYPRNISFVVFPLLTVYFIWKRKLSWKKTLLIAVAIAGSVIYINTLPKDEGSDTLMLACIHLILFSWSILGFAFVGNRPGRYDKRMDYLRFNGDLVVMTTIIIIAGSLFSAVTFGLFRLIDTGAEQFYLSYVVPLGLSASPIWAAYLVQVNPRLVSNISPVIAKIFTPLLLVTLVIYLVLVSVTGNDPFHDRRFLFYFNVLLVSVIALIHFSIAETPHHEKSRAGNSDNTPTAARTPDAGHESSRIANLDNPSTVAQTTTSNRESNRFADFLLPALAVVTIIVNVIALSAILFRITEWGVTPNRIVVLGSNILILTNLLIVTYQLVKSLKKRRGRENVERSIAAFLPIYVVWVAIVTFIFPLLFQFR